MGSSPEIPSDRTLRNAVVTVSVAVAPTAGAVAALKWCAPTGQPGVPGGAQPNNYSRLVVFILCKKFNSLKD